MHITDINTASPPLSVIRIEIERLFGRYTYILTRKDNVPQIDSSLTILYGDNGSGKTTVLKLLFHLLSPKQECGHYLFLAQTPFSRFSVLLANGTSIIATRTDGNLLGTFQLQLLQGSYLFKETIQVEADNRATDRQDYEFYKHLTKLQLNLFLLDDDRLLKSDFFEEKTIEYQRKSIKSFLVIDPFCDDKTSITREAALKLSITRTEEWIREQALKGANQGAENIHSIYEDIITQIIRSSGKIDDFSQSSQSMDILINELKSYEIRSKEFSHFGLMSPLMTQKIVQILQLNPQVNDSIISSILKPYLDSIAARFNALQHTKDLLSLFENTINKFFHDKYIRLHIKDGIRIVTDTGQELFSEMLSSGEKQLLLLFCNTLTARDKATIFIIDEPEISLNVKWQRQLIRALLELTKDSQIQFIVATHSIELLSQYKNNVIKLANIGK
ncbi:AAA family ATPase [Scytonema sp. NUACC26]|uniref:AAA family ATPase n=1 Tax=Scytonema sp. NUACC26 TaxID=3140176 RepID=UPI0034DC3EC8